MSCALNYQSQRFVDEAQIETRGSLAATLLAAPGRWPLPATAAWHVQFGFSSIWSELAATVRKLYSDHMM
jgi:hypothetical protein